MLNTVATWLEARITRQTALVFALVFLPFTVLLQVFMAYSVPGGDQFMPFGFDFPAFWSAAFAYLQGGMDRLYDLVAYESIQKPLAQDESLLLWHYPPTFLALILPLGKLSYPVALVVFTGISVALWLLAVPRILPERSVLGWAASIGAPVVAVTLIQGQNSLIFGALFILAFQAREAGRLWLSAGLIALILAKPHLGLLIPVVLIAAGDWRLFWRTALACLVFLGVTTAITGVESWIYFADNLQVLRFAMAHGDLWPQQVTAFATLSLLGIPAPWPMVAQVISALFAIWIVAVIWRRGEVSPDMKLAILLMAALLVSPYAFRYDMVLTLGATLLIARQAVATGFLPLEKLALTVLWIAPAALPNIADAAHIQIGVPLLLFGIWCCIRRIRHEAATT